MLFAACGGGGDGTTITPDDVVTNTDAVVTEDEAAGIDTVVTPDTVITPDVIVSPDIVQDSVSPEVEAPDVVSTCPALDSCRAEHCSTITDAAALKICVLQQCRTDYEACYGAFGSAGCADAYACAQACTGTSDTCMVDCTDDTSFDASIDFLELSVCIVENCANELQSGKVVSLQQCILASCRTTYETCNGAFGTADCKTLLKCQQNCGGGAGECSLDCMAASSYDANVQFVDLGVCMEENCPEAISNPMGNLGCFTGPCSTYINACCGGSMLNCL